MSTINEKSLNRCDWLPIGSKEKCGRNCTACYCFTHQRNIKRGSTRPNPCIVCGVGVRGNVKLCACHGAKNYRTLALYYKNTSTMNHRAKVITTEQDYLNKFANNLNKENII